MEKSDIKQWYWIQGCEHKQESRSTLTAERKCAWCDNWGIFGATISNGTRSVTLGSWELSFRVFQFIVSESFFKFLTSEVVEWLPFLNILSYSKFFDIAKGCTCRRAKISVKCENDMSLGVVSDRMIKYHYYKLFELFISFSIEFQYVSKLDCGFKLLRLDTLVEKCNMFKSVVFTGVVRRNRLQNELASLLPLPVDTKQITRRNRRITAKTWPARSEEEEAEILRSFEKVVTHFIRINAPVKTLYFFLYFLSFGHLDML